MRTSLSCFVLLLLVAGVLALGFYRGWFSFTWPHNPETGREEVEFQFDKNKTKQDVEKAKKTIGGGSTQPGEKPEGPQP